MRSSLSSICDVHLLGFRQHGHGHGRGVDAPLALGRRHALHAVHAALPAQAAEGTFTPHGVDHLAVAALRALGGIDQLGLPAPLLGVAQVHAGDLFGEQRRLVAAGAGADFQDRVAVVIGVVRQQRGLQRGGGLLQRRFELRQLVPDHRHHVGILLGLQQGVVVVDLPVQGQPGLADLQLLADPGVVAGRLAVLVLVLERIRRRQARRQGVVALAQGQHVLLQAAPPSTAASAAVAGRS